LHPKITLGISPAVSSWTEPLVMAICWFLALNSRRRSAIHRISPFPLPPGSKFQALAALSELFPRDPRASVQPVIEGTKAIYHIRYLFAGKLLA
jgi:hypothetical protein